MGEVIVNDEIYRKLPDPITGIDSVKLSAKKALREWATASGFALLIAIGGFLYDPALVAPLIAKYLPALPAVVTAQLVSALARILVDQARHNTK